MVRLRILIVIALFTAAGCASIVNGPQQRVRITTIPPGAQITVDDQIFKAPTRVWLDRDRDYDVLASMDGFETTQGQLQSVPDSQMAIANCIFFLCIPQLWEGEIRSQYRLEPAQMELNLTPLGWSPR